MRLVWNLRETRCTRCLENTVLGEPSRVYIYVSRILLKVNFKNKKMLKSYLQDLFCKVVVFSPLLGVNKSLFQSSCRIIALLSPARERFRRTIRSVFVLHAELSINVRPAAFSAGVKYRCYYFFFHRSAQRPVVTPRGNRSRLDTTSFLAMGDGRTRTDGIFTQRVKRLRDAYRTKHNIMPVLTYANAHFQCVRTQTRRGGCHRADLVTT